MMAGQGAYTPEELKATALASLGWWHHSIENTIDKLDWDYMQEHLRVYAAWLWELCTALVLPFSFVETADQFAERLTALARARDGIGLAGAVERAQAFRAAAQRLDEAAALWRERKDAAAAEMLNTCMKRLSRTLVPLASTAKGSYGHDPYGYTPQGTMIPSLFDVPRLAKLESEARWMLETQLVRDRNRVADALDDCRALIDTTLRLLGK